MKATTPPWPVVSRILAALLGGYLFTYAFTAALARLLPLGKADAVVVATLPAFLIYTLAILWAFGCRSPRRAWAGLALALPLAVIGFWPQLLETLG
ncbi:iron transporter [Stutzerimonas nosocomialis]|uniref:iron transporter n=1 Tax=Stutzerimonas nosocomialis TaxID=1056496 RepID=UPI001107E1B4|nr:iron transporter [Stutzerimonas nosocomialis]TLX54348.1 iron transporter [Stutzerimonas nosocomialis]